MSVDTLITDIRVNLGNQSSTAISDARILAAINSAINMLEPERFWFQLAETTITTEADEPDLSGNGGWPSDFGSELQPGGFALNYSDRYTPLQKIGVEEYDYRDAQVSNIPRWYTVKADAIHLLPYPDSTYTLKLRYWKKYADLTAGQSNDFTNEAARLLNYISTADLLMDERKDKEKADAYYKRADVEHTRLTKLTNQRRGGAGIRPCGVMPRAA